MQTTWRFMHLGKNPLVQWVRLPDVDLRMLGCTRHPQWLQNIQHQAINAPHYKQLALVLAILHSRHDLFLRSRVRGGDMMQGPSHRTC